MTKPHDEEENAAYKEVLRRSRNQPPTPPPTPPPSSNGHGDGYAARALENEASNVANAPEGVRNHTLNIAAFNLGQLIETGHLDEATVIVTLVNAARSCGLGQREAEATIASGLAGGAQHPRDIPDRPNDTPPTTVLHPNAWPVTDDPDVNHSQQVRALFPILDWHQLWDAEDEDDEWIVEPLIPARRLIALFSAPKIGKSLLMLEIAVAISRGTHVLGETPDRPRRVLYVDFENDPRGDIRQRLRAMGLTPDQLENLCYLSYPTLAKLDNATGAAELLAVTAEYECEVIIIDTISRAVGGEENENDTWLNFYRHTGLALKQAKLTCVRLDHTGKDHDKGMRGGSAKYGDVDAVWKLTRVTPDGDMYKLECSDHRMHFRETEILFTREQIPQLRHQVHAEGKRAAWDLKVREALAHLDASELPNDTAVKPAGEWLRRHGRTITQAVLTEAIRIRKRRLPSDDEEDR